MIKVQKTFIAAKKQMLPKIENTSCCPTAIGITAKANKPTSQKSGFLSRKINSRCKVFGLYLPSNLNKERLVPGTLSL
jgi:hypothetical protein